MTMIQYSTPSSSVYKISTPAPRSSHNSNPSLISSNYHSSGRPLPPLDLNPEPLLVHRGDPAPLINKKPEHSLINQPQIDPLTINLPQQYNNLEGFQQPTDENEEPMYLVQLVPNPKYKQTSVIERSDQIIPKRPKPTRRRMEKNLLIKTEQLQSNPDHKDPSLYPYLYVLSSYLPETHHSLVVAKRS